VAPVFEENLISEKVMVGFVFVVLFCFVVVVFVLVFFFFQRALKDLSQPKTELNFPTDSRGRNKKLISCECHLMKTTTHCEIGEDYFSLGTLKKHSLLLTFVSDAEWRGRNSVIHLVL